MNILVDIDGVVADYDWSRLSKIVGRPIKAEDIYCYHIEECLGLPDGATKEFFAHRENGLVPGARETILRLIDEGHLVFFYTRKATYWNKCEIERWLSNHGIPYADIFYNREDVLAACLRFDYFIDDYQIKLIDMKDYCDNLVLFQRPWNRQCKNILGLLRFAKSWAEVEEMVHECREVPDAS